jgi:hypothetical protein
MAVLQDIALPRTIYERLRKNFHCESRQDTLLEACGQTVSLYCGYLASFACTLRLRFSFIVENRIIEGTYKNDTSLERPWCA